MAVLITFGTDSKLKLKVPAKGETNWAEDFKTYFVDPIVEHDHSGINGRGKQLGPTSLADNAIESRHVNFTLTDLNFVIGSNPQSGQFLKFDGGNWQPGSIDPTVKELTSGDPSATGGIGNSNSGVDLSANSEVYISNVTGADTIDFSARTPATLTGIKFIIDSATTANKKIKFNNLKDCIIISNLDIEIVGSVDKCIIIMENNDATVNSEGANLTLLSNDTAPNNIVNASRIIADTIEVNNATTADKNLFVDSEIKIKQLNLQLLGGSDTNKSRIIRSHVEINDRITNTNTISGSTGQKLFLEDSKVSFPLFQENVSTSATTYSANTSELSVDDDSELKQITTNLVKVWKQSANRWNYLVSPSGINKVITADSSGVPVELSVSDGHVVKGSSSGLVSQDNVLNNINNVNTSGVATDQFLKYDGSNWVDSAFTLTGSKSINTGSSPSTGYLLRYNGTRFEPATPANSVEFVERTVTLTYTLNKSSGYSGNPHYHTFSDTLTQAGLASHLSSAGIPTANITEIKLVGASTYSHSNGYSELYIQKGDDTWLACVKNLYVVSQLNSLEQAGTVSGTIDTTLLPLDSLGTKYTYNSASSTANRSGTFCTTSQEVTLWKPSMSNDPLGDVRLVASEYYMNDGSATYVIKLKISSMTGPTTTSTGSLSHNTGN